VARLKRKSKKLSLHRDHDHGCATDTEGAHPDPATLKNSLNYCGVPATNTASNAMKVAMTAYVSTATTHCDHQSLATRFPSWLANAFRRSDKEINQASGLKEYCPLDL